MLRLRSPVNSVSNGDNHYNSLTWIDEFIPSRAVLSVTAKFGSHGLAVQLKTVGVVDKTIHDRVGVGRIADHFIMP